MRQINVARSPVAHRSRTFRALVSIALLAPFSLNACGGGKTAPNGRTPSAVEPASSSGSASAAGGSSDGVTSGGAPATGSAGGTVAAPSASASFDKIDGKLPDAPKSPTFTRHAECKVGGCNLRTLVPDGMAPDGADKSPVFMWEMTIPRKTMLMMPRHVGADVYGLLIEGEVSVMADDIKDKQKRVWPWIGFRAPGAGVNVYAKEPTRIILAVVANAPGASAADVISAIASKPGSVNWTKRPSPVTAVDHTLQPDLTWGGGAYHARTAIEPTAGESSSASLGILYLSKNAPVAEHVHDKEWEILAVIEGDGELVRPAAAGGKLKVTAGSIVVVPPGTAHAWKPSGSTPLLAVQMYSPPGPEQRFKKLSESTSPPAPSK